MSKKLIARLGAVALAFTLVSTAQAASIVSNNATFAPTTELITFDGYDGLVSSGQYLDDDGDVLFSSAAPSVLGAFEQNLDGNGLWGARFEDSPTGSGNFLSAISPVLFNFGADGPQAQVGAFFNLSQALEGVKSNSLTLTAYGENMEVLESFSILIDTAFDSYNQGLFLGIGRANADIFNFGISAAEGSFVMDNLSLTTAPVPEPESIAMLLAGLAVVGAAVRRRRSA